MHIHTCPLTHSPISTYTPVHSPTHLYVHTTPNHSPTCHRHKTWAYQIIPPISLFLKPTFCSSSDLPFGVFGTTWVHQNYQVLHRTYRVLSLRHLSSFFHLFRKQASAGVCCSCASINTLYYENFTATFHQYTGNTLQLCQHKYTVLWKRHCHISPIYRKHFAAVPA